MKILMKAFYLYILGLSAEFYRRGFERAAEKCVKKGIAISSGSLVRKSNKSYALYIKFFEYERMLSCEMALKKLGKCVS